MLRTIGVTTRFPQEIGEDCNEDKLYRVVVPCDQECSGRRHYMPNGNKATAVEASDAAATGDIVVTAQKRAQNLQDMPVLLNIIRQPHRTSSSYDISGLGSVVPNVSVGTQFGIAQIFIRGIGLDNVFVGADPSVAMHVDGAIVQSIDQLGSFFDLERVEVLRGPQGTLYGRNERAASST